MCYAGVRGGVTVSLDDTTGDAGPDTLEAVENVIGSDGDDEINGDDAPNLLGGSRGDDEIAGGGGADTLWGGRGNDMLLGGSGNDAIVGGRGADRLHGGAGLASLTAGAGLDVFVFDEDSGDAVITEFGADIIDLTAFGFSRAAFERHVTIENDAFLIDVDGLGG